MEINQERRIILQKVERGELSPEEANQQMNELELGEGANSCQPISNDLVASSSDHPPLYAEDLWFVKRWKRWWVYPFAVCVLITILSAFWMYSGWEISGFGWKFFLAWLPFGLGVTGMAVFWRSRTMRWLHVRINQKKDRPHRIEFSLPLPIGFVSWLMRTLGPFMPSEVREKKVGEVLQELDREITADAPFHVFVDEDDAQVEVAVVGGK